MELHEVGSSILDRAFKNRTFTCVTKRPVSDPYAPWQNGEVSIEANRLVAVNLLKKTRDVRNRVTIDEVEMMVRTEVFESDLMVHRDDGPESDEGSEPFALTSRQRSMIIRANYAPITLTAKDEIAEASELVECGCLAFVRAKAGADGVQATYRAA